jgi:hypothetical protein
MTRSPFTKGKVLSVVYNQKVNDETLVEIQKNSSKIKLVRASKVEPKALIKFMRDRYDK